MQLPTSLFFRNHRERTVVHAGPLALRRDDGPGALRRHLRVPRRRELFLVHDGEPALRELAREAGVNDISIEDNDASAAAEMALALGARRLDFAIDEPALERRSGGRLREISLSEAEVMSRDPQVRPPIREKLRAACAGLRCGLARVRIGDAPALTRDRATVLVPDASIPVERPDPRGPAAAAGAAVGVAARPAAT